MPRLPISTMRMGSKIEKCAAASDGGNAPAQPSGECGTAFARVDPGARGERGFAMNVENNARVYAVARRTDGDARKAPV